MYCEETLENVDDILLTETHVNKKFSSTSAARTYDNNYEKYSIPFNKTWKDGRFYKKIVIELYGSGQIGSKIRNAVTGQRYEYIVGSSHEDLFFKVSDATGRYGRKHPLILFYDSPEQYENQHFTSISPEVKSRWQEKHFAARQQLRGD